MKERKEARWGGNIFRLPLLKCSPADSQKKPDRPLVICNRRRKKRERVLLHGCVVVGVHCGAALVSWTGGAAGAKKVDTEGLISLRNSPAL